MTTAPRRSYAGVTWYLHPAKYVPTGEQLCPGPGGEAGATPNPGARCTPDGTR